jgi:hypothetical protein
MNPGEHWLIYFGSSTHHGIAVGNGTVIHLSRQKPIDLPGRLG